MTEHWSGLEEGMEDVRAGDFKVRKPQDEDLDLDQLGMLLRNHVEFTGTKESAVAEDPDV